MLLVKGNRGSAAADVVVGAAVIIFVLLPVFSVVLEKYLILNKAQIIKDAIDMTNISAYNAMNAEKLGKTHVEIETGDAEIIYRRILASNLTLDENLYPLSSSIAEERVEIKSIIFYTGEVSEVCPKGINISRPSVHSVVVVPVRPSLYRRLLLNNIGKQYIELEIHVDSEIPVNN
jgi:hypothetical protein